MKIKDILFEKVLTKPEEIKNWLDKMGIKKYTINPNGTVDVNGNVDLKNKKLTHIPIQFNTVWGSFYCYNNSLISLQGGPKEVGGDFWCNNNQLTTLQGGPREVGGSFWCFNNSLTTLQGCPKEVGGDFFPK